MLLDNIPYNIFPALSIRKRTTREPPDHPRSHFLIYRNITLRSGIFRRAQFLMSVLVEKVDGLKNDGSENSMFIVGSKVVVLRVHSRKRFR